MKFRSDKISGIFLNEGDVVGNTIRAIDPTKKIVVAEGFGVKDSYLPLRLLAYIVPVLRLVKQLPAKTRVEFYIALEGVLRVNGHLQIDKVISNAKCIAELIQRYVAAFYLDLLPQVRILFDRRIEAGGQCEGVIDRLVRASMESCAQDRSIQSFLEDRGPKAFRYMVEHALYMRDPLQIEGECLLVPGMIEEMDEVIMVGGPAEKVFHRARTLLLKAVGSHTRWRSHQFFTPVGSPPTYHYQEGEPVWEFRTALPTDVRELLRQTVSGVSADFNTNVQVLGDLLVLFADAGGCESFAPFKKAQIAKGKWPEENALSVLQAGWEKLRSL